MSTFFINLKNTFKKILKLILIYAIIVLEKNTIQGERLHEKKTFNYNVNIYVIIIT